MYIHISKSLSRWLALLLTVFASVTAHATIVTVDAQQIVNIQNIQMGNAYGTLGIAVFEVDITEIGGVDPGYDSNLIAFCIEGAETISPGQTYSDFTDPLPDLQYAARGSAGAGKSIDISASGIGSLRAARIEYLFDSFFLGTAYTDWTLIENYAFQLAVWELSHDDDMSLDDPGGSTTTGFWIDAGNTDTTVVDSINTAKGYLADVSSSNVTSTYTSTAWDIALLENNPTSGADIQDLITVTGAVPEPSTYAAAFGAVALLIALIRRRKAA